jgi:membrane associated rhomboid family serine protease
MFFPLFDDNPTIKRPIITWILIAVNLVVWLVLQGAGLDEEALEASIELFGFPPGELLLPLSIGSLFEFLFFGLTSMFTHGSWIHLLGNLWFLWLLGNNVEDSMSRTRFLIMYLLCGYSGCLAHAVITSDAGLFGASGAVSGISAAYLVLYPKCRIYTALVVIRFIMIFRIPAFLFVGLMSILDIASVLFDESSDVSHWAHIGGFLSGLILIKIFVQSERLLQHPHTGWNPLVAPDRALTSDERTLIERLGIALTFIIGIGLFFSFS